MSDLTSAISVFSQFQNSQASREDVEQEIQNLFPEIANRTERLSYEALLVFISALVIMMGGWLKSPTDRSSVVALLDETVKAIERESQDVISTAFELYESGKNSAHSLRNKIIRFFPKLRDEISGMNYGDLVSTIALIVAALERWKPKERLSEYKGPSKEQYEELIRAIRELKKHEN